MTSDKDKKTHEDAASVSELIPRLSGKVIGSEPTEWLAFNQGIIPSPVSIKGVRYTGNTYTELTSFCLGNTGITATQFKAGSPKSLEHQFEEIKRRDVTIVLNIESHPTRVIERYSKNAIAIVYDSRTWEAVYEIGRVIIDSATMILHPEPKLQGCRETALLQKPIHVPGGIVHYDEPAIITIIRGLIQEPGYAAHADDLVLLTETPAVDPHDSTVFLCPLTDDDGNLLLKFVSYTSSHVFGLDVASQGYDSIEAWYGDCARVHRDGDLFLIEDEGTLLMYEILSIPEKDPVLRLLKSLHNQL